MNCRISSFAATYELGKKLTEVENWIEEKMLIVSLKSSMLF